MKIPRGLNRFYGHPTSDLFTKWENILFLLCKCAIFGTRTIKIGVESLFIEQNCVGFVTKGSTKKMSYIHYETQVFHALFHPQILHQSKSWLIWMNIFFSQIDNMHLEKSQLTSVINNWAKILDNGG